MGKLIHAWACTHIVLTSSRRTLSVHFLSPSTPTTPYLVHLLFLPPNPPRGRRMLGCTLVCRHSLRSSRESNEDPSCSSQRKGPEHLHLSAELIFGLIVFFFVLFFYSHSELINQKRNERKKRRSTQWKQRCLPSFWLSGGISVFWFTLNTPAWCFPAFSLWMSECIFYTSTLIKIVILVLLTHSCGNSSTCRWTWTPLFSSFELERGSTLYG